MILISFVAFALSLGVTYIILPKHPYTEEDLDNAIADTTSGIKILFCLLFILGLPFHLLLGLIIWIIR